MYAWTHWSFAALALALVAGPLVAFASVQLPAPGTRPGLSRLVVCTLVCLALAAWGARLAPGPAALVTVLLAAQLMLLSLLDGEHFWLPHRLTVPLGIAGIAEALAFAPHQLTGRLIGALIGFFALWAIAAAYRRYRGREGLGGGDFRLLAAAGAWVGWSGLPSVLVWASLLGIGAVLVRLALRRGVGAGEAVPFGIFLAAGLWLTWLYGPLGR